ncbi:zinc finger, CCHC-type, retrotransposon gag domain protein [Tanacetum coccineum]|uniref:Zinc finger, CCHC-type, retrotransposon gag domain protein n=1 Tax=Tanacetum coccineum TaxID=301880 RepID=A0ABQ5HP00_9ASTR
MVTTRRNSDDDVPNFEAMITAAVANALPNLTAALRTQITNDIRNGAGPSGGGGGDAIPQGIHVWIERFTKLKPLAFRSAATPAEAEDWITHMEKLFQVLGCPDNFKTRLAAFKLEGDALSWWKAHLRTQVGGDAFADTCTWVAFREIFYNRYFPASEQQRYEREYGSICQLDRENSGEYMERFTRLASFVGATAGDAQRQARHFKWGLKKWVLDRIVNTQLQKIKDYTKLQVAAAARNIELLHESGNSNKRDRDGNRIQNRGQGQQENKGRYDQGQHEYRGRQDQSVEHRGRQDRGYDSKRQDFRGQDQRFTGRNGNDRQGQGNYNQRQYRSQSTRDFNQGHASGSAGQRRSTETLPPPPLCTTCGKPHPGVCYKATGGCFTCGSTQHKVKDCPQAKQKQSMPADFARLPPTTGRVYATTRDCNDEMRSLEKLDVRLRGREKRKEKKQYLQEARNTKAKRGDGMKRSLLIFFEMNGRDEMLKDHGFVGYPFDYRVTLGFGSIAGGLDHVNTVIRLPLEHRISRVLGKDDHSNPKYYKTQYYFVCSRSLLLDPLKDGWIDSLQELSTLGTSLKKPLSKGPYLDEECPLNEEVKQLEEVKYGACGHSAPFNRSNGAKFCIGPPGYYTHTDNRPPYGEKRPSLEELMNKHQEEST